MGTFSGEEFARALAEDALKQPITLAGMVKKAEDSEVILFATGTVCENWVSIPVGMIEKVEWLGNVPCKDHWHHFVYLTLKEQAAKNSQASVFSDLLRRSSVSSPGELATAVAHATGAVHPLLRMASSGFRPGLPPPTPPAPFVPQPLPQFPTSPPPWWTGTGFPLPPVLPPGSPISPTWPTPFPGPTWPTPLPTPPTVTGAIIRDPNQCVFQFECPWTVTCSDGRQCVLILCGSGSCPGCPGGLGNLLIKGWCSYLCNPSGSAFMLKTFLGTFNGPWCFGDAGLGGGGLGGL
jgi:hypothetical protein